MPYVYVDSTEILEAIDEVATEELEREMQRRREKDGQSPAPDPESYVARIYEHFKLNGGAPDCVREFIWAKVGKVV